MSGARGGCRRRLGLVALVGLALLAGAALVLALHARSLWNGGRPARDGEHTLAGLGAAVTVRFDARAVPRVEAETDLDLARAVGWLHANDRMTQLELLRRVARGRLASLLGPPAAGVDERLRHLRVRESAEAWLEGLSPVSRAWLDAYADGVNAWLAERDGELPPLLALLRAEVAPWRPADSLGVAVLMAVDLADLGHEERRALRLATLSIDHVADLVGADAVHEPDGLRPLAVEIAARYIASAERAVADRGGADRGGASNAFAVAGEASAGGVARLASDPHLGLSLPARFVLVDLVSAEGYRAAGATLPGLPLVIVGANDRRAWGLTTTGLDQFDTAWLEPDEAGREPELDRAREPLPVRFGADREVELLSQGGEPVLPASDLAPARVVRWVAHGASDPLAGFLALGREADLDAALAAFESFHAPAQNLLVAEADGRLVGQVIGRAPARRRGDGRLPARRADAAYGWDGLVPYAANPREEGERALVHANDAWFGADPRFPADVAPPARAARIAEALDAGAPLDGDGLRRVQTDVRSVAARELLAVVDDVLVGSELSPDAAAARAALDAWDGELAALGASALYALFERDLVEAVVGDELEHGPAPWWRWRVSVAVAALRGETRARWLDDGRTPERVETATSIVEGALASAWRVGRERWGSDASAWKLGELQTLTLEHPLSALPLLGARLDRGPFPTAGDPACVLALWIAWEGDARPVRGGPALRLVAAPGADDPVRAVLPGGQSGHPADPHYDDQLDAWRAGELFPIGGAAGVSTGRPSSEFDVRVDGILTLVPAGDVPPRGRREDG